MSSCACLLKILIQVQPSAWSHYLLSVSCIIIFHVGAERSDLTPTSFWRNQRFPSSLTTKFWHDAITWLFGCSCATNRGHIIQLAGMRLARVWNCGLGACPAEGSRSLWLYYKLFQNRNPVALRCDKQPWLSVFSHWSGSFESWF